jgi:hypothetical protein
MTIGAKDHHWQSDLGVPADSSDLIATILVSPYL